MSSYNNDRPNDQFSQQNSNDAYNHNQLNIPKLRNIPPNAVPATPRMLRNSSNSSSNHNIDDEYTINPDYISHQRTPSKRLPNVHQRQPSEHNNNNGNLNGNSNNNTKNLLPPVEFNNHNYNTTPSNNSNIPSTPRKSSNPAYNNNQNANQYSTPNRINPTTPHPVSNPNTQQKQQQQQQQLQLQQQQQQFHRKAIGDWEFTKTIGAGSMGKVKLAKHRITNEICAIKVVTRAAKVWQRQRANDPPTNDLNELNQRKKEFEKEVARDKRTIREAALGKILYHPYICRLYEMYSMSNHYYMLFEYVSGGQMLDYIVAHGSLKESQARKFCRGIGSALEYCHYNNIVHRDLKIENIMINNQGEIKIIDFGLSNLFTNDHLLKTYCGSLYFAAPELLSAKPYKGPEVDIWSFGVVLFVLVCGRVPFDDKSVSNLHEKIKKGYIEYPDHLSPECIDLLKKMLVVDVNKRATISQVISHKWMIKGYGSIVSNYIPNRFPLQLPLDLNVINEIVNLNLGSSEDDVLHELTDILSSKYYNKCVNNWILKNSNEKYDPTLLDPTKSFHPLISIYFLVHEMLERKKSKMSNTTTSSTSSSNTNINNIQSPHIQQTPIFNANSQNPNMVHEPQNRIVTQPVPHEYQHQKSFQQPQVILPTSTSNKPGLVVKVPNNAYSLPFPQAAHTSPHTEFSQHSFGNKLQPNLDLIPHQLTPPPQQQPSPMDDIGVNSLLRKLSTTKRTSKDDELKRIGSVKVTSKEKQQQQQAQPNYLSSSTSAQNSIRRNQPHHQRATSAYTPSIFNPDPIQSQSQSQSQSQGARKYHPSARANSVGHTRKHSFNITKSGAYQVDSNAPPLPNFRTPKNNDYDGFFDEEIDNLQFSNNSERPKKRLTDQQIIEQFERAPKNSMPSIEYPKTLFLKGFFSVQTTSTKPLPIIRYDIVTILPQLGVEFVEVNGGFICIHYPSIIDTPKRQTSASIRTRTSSISSPSKSPTKSTLDSNKIDEIFRSTNPNHDDNYANTTEGLKTPTLSETSSSISKSKNSLPNEDNNSEKGSVIYNSTVHSTPSKMSNSNGHRRKFSLGNGILGSRKGDKISLSTNTPTINQNEINIPTTPAPANFSRRSTDESSESLALDETNGASDMLVSSRLEQQNYGNRSPTVGSGVNSGYDNDKKKVSKTPLKFEIHIVKVPLVGLYGIQFKKVSGNTWLYKSLASEILNRLNL